MDAPAIRKAVTTSMNAAGFERGRGARWVVASDDLFWIFELDRGASWSSWGLVVGVAVRAWRSHDGLPRASEGAVMTDYALLGAGVPPDTSESRFDDHRSYFTMVFDHRHAPRAGGGTATGV